MLHHPFTILAPSHTSAGAACGFGFDCLFFFTKSSIVGAGRYFGSSIPAYISTFSIVQAPRI
jgi:hypothetical protein